MSRYDTISTLKGQIRGRENQAYNTVVLVERLVITL